MSIDELDILSKFEDWLRSERGLAEASVRTEVWHAEKFIRWLSALDVALNGLDASAVLRFVAMNAAQGYSRNYLKNRHRAMKTFLRFLHVRGITARSLADAVPAVAGWSLASVPRGLSYEQVQALLEGFDRSTAVGIRDHAMALFLARLGLRRIEISRLLLSDVDWRSGTFCVLGKGSQREQLPLLAEQGEALRDYVLHARPHCECPSVFITMRRPYRAVSPLAISAAMARACRRADLPNVGTHQFRHTLAINMLNSGSGLPEIGNVLRHHSLLSTAIYAKSDLNHLRTLARPWPTVSS